jgi:hypothetical protein
MKRSASRTPTPPSTLPSPTASTNPTTPKKTKVEPQPKTPKTPKSTPVKSRAPGIESPVLGEWTADKREDFMGRIIAAGYKAVDLASMAEEVGGGSGRDLLG